MNRHRQRLRHRQRGIALIIVMLLLLMTVLIASTIMERLDQDRARTASLMAMEQGYAYLLSAEALGVRALDEDLKQDREAGRETDACSEQEWAKPVGPLPWDRGLFLVSIQDLQARYNLNNVVITKDGQREIDRLAAERLKRVLRAGLPTDSAGKADALGEEALDWIDSNTVVDGLGGAEDTEYEQWRTANDWVADPSELRALNSADAASFAAGDAGTVFSRYITALSEGIPVNANTAPATVLSALVPGLDSSRADAVVKARKDKPFGKVDDLLALPELASLGENEKKELKSAVSVGSQYFRITSQVTLDGRTMRLVSDVFRPRQGGQPRIIRRDLGDPFATATAACNAEGGDGDDSAGQGDNTQGSGT